MLTPRSKFDKACSLLLRDYPFWGSILLSLQVEESQSLPTMATDGVKLMFGSDYVTNQELRILITDTAHEVGHVMFKDMMRRGMRDPRLWNIACDYRINSFLKESGFQLGEDYLYDPKFRGWDAEKIYNYLQRNPEEQPQQSCGCGGLHDHPDVKKGEGQGSQSGQEDQSGHEHKNGEGAGSEEQVGGSSPSGGSEAAPSVGQTEAAIDMALAQARAFAKAAGRMPGNLEIAVEEIINPKISWAQITQQFLERCAASDFTWQMPDRRTQYLGLYLPSMESDEINEIVLVLDTSGSTASAMATFKAEFSEIIKVVPISKLHVLYVDSRVQRADTFTRAEFPPTFVPMGGGGTDFRPPFDWLAEQGINPKGLIYFTDLECYSFPDDPSFPVLWVKKGSRGKQPPFGEVVDLN